MFDLEQSIADWRKQMLAAGIKTPVPLEELEIHLREDIEQQIQLGTNPQQAFESSVQRIGHADELKSEFRKTCGTKCYSQWSLLWIGVIGLVTTPILNLVGLHVFHRTDSVFFSHPWWPAWLPSYIVWTTFTISGLVFGFANWNTRWALLWISGIGLIGTMMVNLVGLLVFHSSSSVFFSSDWVDYWFWFYLNWMIFIILGLVLGLANWKLRLKLKLQFKTSRD
jgi:hypothetical protein